jgi:hypothetical protein
MIYTDGQSDTLVAVCEHCREAVITKRVWAQAGTARKPVIADVVCVIIAQDKYISLWARGEQVGLMTGHTPAPTLASTATKLGGKWIALRRDTWVRPEAITRWTPDGSGGANTVVDGLAVHAAKRYWPAVKSMLE